MTDQITQVVIVGGGSAGWLAAGVIAALSPAHVQVTLIESPDINLAPFWMPFHDKIPSVSAVCPQLAI